MYFRFILTFLCLCNQGADQPFTTMLQKGKLFIEVTSSSRELTDRQPFSYERWNGSSISCRDLLPVYTLSDTETKIESAIRLLGQMSKDPNFPFERLICQSSTQLNLQPFAQLGPFRGGASKLFPYPDLNLDEGDTKLTFKIDTSIQFRRKNDQNLLSFGVKNGFEGGELRGAPVKKSRPQFRVPIELKVISQGKPMPALSSQKPSVGKVVELLRQELHVDLFADARVEMDELVIGQGTNCHPTCFDLLNALACAENLYWRQVGDKFFLAVSSDDPRDMAKRVWQAELDKLAAPVWKRLSASGVIPNGLDFDWIKAGYLPLMDLQPEFLSNLRSQIHLRSSDSEDMLLRVQRDPASYEVRVSVNIVPWLQTRSTTIGGIALTLEKD